MEIQTVEYVLGFAFDGVDRVLLRLHEDTGPEAVRGRWNGLGGKIEEGEAPVDATRREFFEEGGLDVARDRWERTVTLTGRNGPVVWVVRCFRARLHAYEVGHVDRQEEHLHKVGQGERVRVRFAKLLGEYGRFDALNIVPNLRWLVPLHGLDELVSGSLAEEEPKLRIGGGA